MKCKKCGQENKEDSKFCMKCGSILQEMPYCKSQKKSKET